MAAPAWWVQDQIPVLDTLLTPAPIWRQGWRYRVAASMRILRSWPPNPLGVSATPASFNFALQPGSPALAAGTSVGAPATDIWGTPRANPPAIGAYEPSSQAAHVVLVSSLSCAAASLASKASTTCTVTLGLAAAAGGVTVVTFE